MELAKYIDHTLLKPDATSADIQKLCAQAREHGFFGVCVNSSHIALAARELEGSTQKVVSVIGFPLGAMATEIKAREAEYALAQGASEIDMVLNIGAMKDKDYSRVAADIKAVADVCRSHLLKVILETALLTEDEKQRGCELSVEAGAHFVKTCTGFSGGKAEVNDIVQMRKWVGESFGVKASGGIKTFAAATELIRAGANRLGTSSGPALIKNENVPAGTY